MFSHDELVCKMAAQCSELDLPVVVVVAEDSMAMVAVEEEIRRGLTTVSGCGHCTSLIIHDNV